MPARTDPPAKTLGATVDPSVVVGVMRALSNPNRLRIFSLVREACVSEGRGDLCVGEISEALGISQSTVSHHLREMEHAGLLTSVRNGKNVFCRVRTDAVEQVMEYLGS